MPTTTPARRMSADQQPARPTQGRQTTRRAAKAEPPTTVGSTGHRADYGHTSGTDPELGFELVIEKPAIGYVRVSTDEQADSGLGMEAQRDAIAREADRRGWTVQWHVDAGYSGSTLKRPALAEAFAALRAGEAGVLVIAKLDRLSRSAQDFANTMASARNEDWELVALDLGVDTTNASGRLMAGVMAQFAEYEREVIAQRTRDALAAAKARGQRLGRPRATPDAVVAQVVALAGDGLRPSAIAARLTADGVPTTRGAAAWSPSSVRRVLSGHALDVASRNTDGSNEAGQR